MDAVMFRFDFLVSEQPNTAAKVFLEIMFCHSIGGIKKFAMKLFHDQEGACRFENRGPDVETAWFA